MGKEESSLLYREKFFTIHEPNKVLLYRHSKKKFFWHLYSKGCVSLIVSQRSDQDH